MKSNFPGNKIKTFLFVFVVLLCLPVYSEENSQDSVYLVPDFSISLEQEYNIKRHEISQKQETVVKKFDFKPSNLLTFKKTYPLLSPLSKKYALEAYMLRNVSNELVEIRIYMPINPNRVIQYVKMENEKERSPKIMLDSVNDFGEAITALYLFPPAGIAMTAYSTIKVPFNVAKSFYNTLLFPYHSSINKQEIELYKCDLELFNSLKNSESNVVLLNPNEEATFSSLIFLGRKQMFGAKYQDGSEYRFDL